MRCHLTLMAQRHAITSIDALEPNTNMSTASTLPMIDGRRSMRTATTGKHMTMLFAASLIAVGISAMLSMVGVAATTTPTTPVQTSRADNVLVVVDDPMAGNRMSNGNHDDDHKSTAVTSTADKALGHSDVSLQMVSGSDANGDAATDVPFSNHGRFVSSLMDIMGRQQPSEQYQECQTPNGLRGHCKYASHCQFPNGDRPNLIKMIGYLCVIRGFYIGVCCPDDEISEKAGFAFPHDKVEPDGPPIWAPVDNNLPEPQTNGQQRPEDRGCGLATRSFPKITGGRPADPGEWPWMAALLRHGPSTSFCGGVLVTDRHVLTAAHCTHRRRAAEIFVRLGEYDFDDYNETRARDFRVVDIRQHFDFDDNTYEHDIALLKLDRPALFTSYIWPVCMPPDGQPWEGYRAVVTGWGTQFFGGPPSNVLMEVALPIWTRQRCELAYAQRISSAVLCAGSPEGGRDSCQGDSGGPLMVQLANGRWVVAGVVSWGVRCGEPNFPGIYTRVDAYSAWIIENAIF